MIVVIADDLTGAAELAGISSRYGLSTTICLGEPLASETDVLIVCTDSRSLTKAEAIKITAEVVTATQKIQPEFIFKKIDSVLRGHVLDELKVQMQLTGFVKALILAANPSLGRVIRNGHYFIEGKKISETVFAADPEFPVKSSLLKKMLGDNGINVLKHSDQLPAKGFVIGETENLDDIGRWLNAFDSSWLLAGSADFYTALLSKRSRQHDQNDVVLTPPVLYVCGTADEKRKKHIRDYLNRLDCVTYITQEELESKHCSENEWVQNTVDRLNQHHKAILTFAPGISKDVSARLLRAVMARTVKKILDHTTVSELIIEGGSTAAAILSELKVKELSPVNELQPGVVRMKTADLFVTVKPGSYAMPKQIADLF